MAQPGGGLAGGTPPPRKLGIQENSWLRHLAKYTKLCMVWQPNILNNCYELSGGYAPPNHPPGALPLDPAGGLPFPRPSVPPPPNLGYATASHYYGTYCPAASVVLSRGNDLLTYLVIQTSAAKGGSHSYAGKISTMNIMCTININTQ